MEKHEVIIDWLKKKAKEAGAKGFVVGVSGGVDSTLVSTLCAFTGLQTIVVSMPIHSHQQHHDLSLKHGNALETKFANVQHMVMDLSASFDELSKVSPFGSELAYANARSRLRMVNLYLVANTYNLLVAGTGNKVEDFGIGFFTKYGDGGVDISPIGDLLKSEVRELAKVVGVDDEIVNAVPTDGLWGDGRSDEDQIGATYEELEWAMQYYYDLNHVLTFIPREPLTERQQQVLDIYINKHKMSEHKMSMPPICKVSE